MIVRTLVVIVGTCSIVMVERLQSNLATEINRRCVIDSQLEGESVVISKREVASFPLTNFNTGSVVESVTVIINGVSIEGQQSGITSEVVW